jgi:hypothetical protein
MVAGMKNLETVAAIYGAGFVVLGLMFEDWANFFAILALVCLFGPALVGLAKRR